MPNTINNILYMGSDHVLARMLQARMERNHLKVEMVSSAEAGLAMLTQERYDVLLVDYHLPGMNGLEFLDRLSQLPDAPPAIMLTPMGDDRMAIAALEKGAADYAFRDAGQTYLDLLPAVMHAAFIKHRLVRENEIQRQELQAAKEKAEAANQAKSNFLATMSHEMRTPLNVVIGLARLLAKAQLAPKEKQMAETLLTNADLLLKLINDLLDISRIEAGVLELENIEFDFSSVLRDIKAMFETAASSKHLRFTVIDDTQHCPIMGDRTRVQQVLMNLVSNALKFTSEGSITLHATCEPQEYDTLFTVRVEDTGIGIPPEKLPTIFDKFTQADESITRRFGGSGLGLSIARSLVQRMGGSIRAESSNIGSTFIVTFRFTTAESAQAKIDRAVHFDPHALRRTVLVVEDYMPNVMVASMILESLGFEPVTAENGAMALDCVRNADAPFAAILMDVQMQDMDGFETTRRIRELEAKKGIRNVIIGVTAHALAGDRERCISAGMDDYMSKPIHPDLLSTKLARIASMANKAA